MKAYIFMTTKCRKKKMDRLIRCLPEPSSKQKMEVRSRWTEKIIQDINICIIQQTNNYKKKQWNHSQIDNGGLDDKNMG